MWSLRRRLANQLLECCKRMRCIQVHTADIVFFLTVVGFKLYSTVVMGSKHDQQSKHQEYVYLAGVGLSLKLISSRVASNGSADFFSGQSYQIKSNNFSFCFQMMGKYFKKIKIIALTLPLWLSDVIHSFFLYFLTNNVPKYLWHWHRTVFSVICFMLYAYLYSFVIFFFFSWVHWTEN